MKIHDTLLKFGYPDFIVCEYEHWVLLVRPQQVTLGSMVLVARSSVTALKDLPQEAFVALRNIIIDIETTLTKLFDFDKINYLALMMVDPEVHFHIIPRYGSPVFYFEQEFVDLFWPGPVDLKTNIDQSTFNLEKLVSLLRDAWSKI